MKPKLFFADPGFWMLIIFNVYGIIYFLQNPNSIHSLYIVFWLQSVIIGVFNFLGILFFTNRVSNSFTVNDSPGNKPGCAALFFLVHYGFFHLVYFVFLIAVLVNAKEVNYGFIQISFFALIAGYTIQFMQDKRRNTRQPVNIGTMFFFPYARIIPMHLAILLPNFFHISAPIIFLLLKLLADVIMYIIYQIWMFKEP